MRDSIQCAVFIACLALLWLAIMEWVISKRNNRGGGG